jgi:beta-lactamase regulating signal transducer with metallopeptidase domain/biopolymer transport protein ExbD
MITVINELGGAWGVWFLSAVVQNTIFLILVILALFLLRRASARVLAAVATVGVIKLAIPPFVPVGWFGSGAAETLADPVAPLLFPFAEGQSAPMEIVADLTGGLGLAAVLMLAWLSIATARLGWALLQSVQLYVELRRSIPVSAAEIPPEMLDQGLDIRQSDRVAVPLTMGIFHRRILVPACWTSWSMADRLAVLRHELAHIRRRDNLVQPIEVFVQAVFFFHPLVTLLIRRLRIWREMACDDLSVGTDPNMRLAYSRFLVDLATTVIEPRPMAESASTLARHKCELMKRVTHQVKGGIMNPVSRMRLAAVLTVLLLAVVPLSLVYGDDPPPPPKKAAPVAEPVMPAEPAAPEKVVKAGDPVDPESPPPPPTAVHVGLSDAGLTVNGQVTSYGDFQKTVKIAASKNDGKVVVKIESQGAVTMGKVHGMQAKLKDIGLNKVVYSGELGQAVPVVLPPEKALKKLASMPEEMILNVKVNPKGVLTVADTKVAGEDLPKLIKKKLAEEPKLVVALHTEPETRYGAFLQVLQGLKKGGATRIAILDPGR